MSMKPHRSDSVRPGSFMKTEARVFVGNLPRDITEMQIVDLFKDFDLKEVKKLQNQTSRGFAFLDMQSPKAVELAVQKLNGILLKGHRIVVSVFEDRRSTKFRKSCAEMPELEPISNGLPTDNGDLTPKPGVQTVPPSAKRNVFGIPVEMRCSFLVPMLRDCFKDLGWLIPISKIFGEAALLVTDTLPQTPFFWGIHLTEANFQNTQKLFSALAEVESQMPFLVKEEVQQGTRCMAECILGEEGGAWNRCWVMDKVEHLAVVFFMDFGRMATVPLNSLRRLDKDDFWKIQPLAQPFMLYEDIFPPQVMDCQILKGTVVQQSQAESHISMFIPKSKLGEGFSKDSQLKS